MNRKRFLADALMAIAVSLVPKILQPVVPEVEGVAGPYYYPMDEPISQSFFDSTFKCRMGDKLYKPVYYIDLTKIFQ